MGIKMDNVIDINYLKNRSSKEKLMELCFSLCDFLNKIDNIYVDHWHTLSIQFNKKPNGSYDFANYSIVRFN